VDIEPEPVAQAPTGATEPVQARVLLDRWPAWRLRYGLDVTDEAAPLSEGRTFGTGITADLQRRGLFGRAGTLGTSGRFNQDERIGRAFFALRSLAGLPVTTSFFASRAREYIEEARFLSIITDRTTFTAEQRFNLRPTVLVSYGYQFERNHTFDPAADPDDPLAFDLTTRAARLTSTVVVDTRDDPFNAARGWFHASNVEYASAALGSELRFVKYLLQQFFFRPLAPAVVSASAIRVGAGRGFGQELLPSERFYAGGVNTVRGYAEDSLGSRDFFGDAQGGQAEIILNQELRFPLFRWIRGVGFLDAGNVFDRAGDLSLTGLAVGVGAGLRFSTPVGLFRLDLGVPLSRLDADQVERRPRWHFSFGQMF
jgi:outer membrane protein assembly factor BamA